MRLIALVLAAAAALAACVAPAHAGNYGMPMSRAAAAGPDHGALLFSDSSDCSGLANPDQPAKPC